jgi:hypothetical protein
MTVQAVALEFRETLKMVLESAVTPPRTTNTASRVSTAAMMEVTASTEPPSSAPPSTGIAPATSSSSALESKGKPIAKVEAASGGRPLATGTGESSYGVYAYAENAESMYVDGNAGVLGHLTKGGGSFKIDHPVDPAGKYLYHSFVESSDMMNVYNGTVSLDGGGRATVELPDWFEALNRDYRYQLTPIGGPAPDLHISHEVKDGAFVVAGGKVGQKVSWQVTGIRQDAWANANRIPVEVDKKPEDQGRYLHAELFGGEPITALAVARAHRIRHH